jgi:uncharacterized protein YggT (Ycf19 family)
MTNTSVEIDQTTVSPLRRLTLWVARALAWLLNAYILIVEVILLLGFILLLGGADPNSSFVQWAYRNLDRAMKPFRGLFEPIEIGTTSGGVSAVVDTSILFAMIIYGIVLLVAQALLGWLNSRAHRLDQIDADYRQQQITEQQLAAMQTPTAVYNAPPQASAPAGAPVPPAQPPAQAPGDSPTGPA